MSLKTVEEYIRKHSTWESALIELRKIVLSQNLKETIKWGSPVYTFQNENIVGLAAFKSYVGIWFFQGVLLKDESNVLMNAQEGKTKAMRQWRFMSTEEIMQQKSIIEKYVQEAIHNQEKGIKIKPDKSKPLSIPKELQDLLNSDTLLHKKFDDLSLTKKREFAKYIDVAKKEETKQTRLNKIKPLILNGIGLNDKYRK